MKENFEVLQICPLFAGIAETDVDSLLSCLSARQIRYKKNSFIWNSGDKFENIGIVLDGAVHVLKEDFWGRRSILTRI